MIKKSCIMLKLFSIGGGTLQLQTTHFEFSNCKYIMFMIGPEHCPPRQNIYGRAQSPFTSLWNMYFLSLHVYIFLYQIVSNIDLEPKEQCGEDLLCRINRGSPQSLHQAQSSKLSLFSSPESSSSTSSTIMASHHFSSSSFFTTFRLCFCLLFPFLLGMASAQLTTNYYSSSCPNALSIIKSAVNTAVNNEARMGASLLRLHFHDCFVNASHLLLISMSMSQLLLLTILCLFSGLSLSFNLQHFIYKIKGFTFLQIQASQLKPPRLHYDNFIISS